MGRALRGKTDYGIMIFADKASSGCDWFWRRVYLELVVVVRDMEGMTRELNCLDGFRFVEMA